jgi:hypothetical protein
MQKLLNFIQSCVRRGLGNDDLAYLTKWAMADYANTSFEEFAKKVEEYCESKFFDRNNLVREILEAHK